MRARALVLLLAAASAAGAEARRIVVIKSDGVPGYLVEELVNTKDENTGTWALPWIRRVFFEGGARLSHFYSRGLSVSTPSWNVLETGRDPILRGNVEFDRYSLHAYDYLNFFPFYFRHALSRQVDTSAVEVLDGVGLPLLSDSFAAEETYRGVQLFQRGVPWNTLAATLRRALSPSSIRDLVDEWITGFEMQDRLHKQVEQELIRNLSDPRVRYLDLFHTDFDHIAHLTHDRRVLLRVLRDLDGLVGRVWTAIERGPLAAETALILVSDHGINNDPAVFGQGWNLVDALRGTAGGAHHVITNRHPRADYKVKGLNPFVSTVVNESAEATYLKGQASEYPTALVDLDGNERASLYLRNSDWNAAHILLRELQRPDLALELRSAAARALADLAGRNRDTWRGIAGESPERFDEVAAYVSKTEAELKRMAKRLGLDAADRRRAAQVERTAAQLSAYREYLRAASALLALNGAQWDGRHPPLEKLVPRRAMGEPNSIRQLRNYVAGLSSEGLKLAADGSLDWERSFRAIDYFAFFSGVETRNAPQPAVGTRPVDFIAARVPKDDLPPELEADRDGVWLYKSETKQALVVSRRRLLRYTPVRRNGDRFELAAWEAGLPLALYEDPAMENRREWLDGWHADDEWLRATHRCAYANAVVGLYAQMAPLEERGDGDLLRGFEWRQRRAVAPDLLILASNHWNFNVRGFNPGGNHGSFFPVSMQATLLLAGAGVPRGLAVEAPYDALSFAPTVLKLAGKSKDLPGRVIEELFREYGTDPDSSGLSPSSPRAASAPPRWRSPAGPEGRAFP
jgi:hypothetical protein